MGDEPVNKLYPFSTCTLCGVTKPTTRSNFGTKKNGKPRPWCRECSRKKTNEHAASNRELGRDRARKRKELLESIGVVNEHLQYRELLLRKQSYKCYFCEAPINEASVEIDHLTPLSRGGDNSISNLAACCSSCNKAKTDKTEEEFVQWRRTRLKNYS